MTNRYEALLILDTTGKEDDLQGIIESLESDFKAEGAVVEQIQKMDRRNFSYVAGRLSSGYYVNFIFNGPPDIIERLKARFRLKPVVYRQHYQKLKPAAKAA